MTPPQPSPARQYVYKYANHRIEVDLLLSDLKEQDEVEQLSRERRSSLHTKIESLKAQGGRLVGPDNEWQFPLDIREFHADAGPQTSPSCGNPPQAQADHQALDTPCVADATPAGRQMGGGKTKGKHIAARMMLVGSENHESVFWTVKKWAGILRCSTGTIAGLPYWRTLATVRACMLRERAERADQTAVRPKGGRSRKQRNQE